VARRPEPGAGTGRPGEQVGQNAQHGRHVPPATVVGPALAADPRNAAAQLSAYAEAGTERVILAPSGAGWQHDYEFAGELRAAL
jgi:hypothetical protein